MNYFSVIGRLGGLSGKGSPAKKKAAIKAAKCRWAKHTKQKVILRLTNDGLILSHQIPGLEEVLAAHKYTKTESGGLTVQPISVYHQAPGTSEPVISPRLLSRVTDHLDQLRRTYKIDDTEVTLVRPEIPENSTDLSAREMRVLSRMLKSRFGAFAYLREQRRQPFIVELVSTFKNFRGIIVAPKVDEAKALREALNLRLQTNIGLLAENSAEKERITVVTWEALTQGVIDPDDCDLIVATNIPKKGYKRLGSILSFRNSVRYGFIGQENRSSLRTLEAELAFGPFIKVQ